MLDLVFTIFAQLAQPPAALPILLKPPVIQVAQAAEATPAKASAARKPSKPSAVAKGEVAAPDAAAQVVGNVQKFYASVKQVTSKFRQSVTNVTFGDTKESDGMMWIAKPGKMRWDYYSKKREAGAKKSFISNGTYLYVVEHDNKQVIQKNLQRDLMPVAVSFLYGKGNLSSDFNAKLDTSGKYGSSAEHVLALTPKKPSAQYQTLVLVVAKDNYRVTQSVIIDAAGNVNHFKYFEPDFEQAIAGSSFEFDAKSVPGYRVIDADKEAAAPTPASK